MNTTEIKKKYLEIHNALGARKDAKDAELFDVEHGQVWADCDVELKARKDELVVKIILTEDEVVELRYLKMEFPDPLPPSRDLAAEIDVIKADIVDINTSLTDGITASVEK